MVGEAKARRAGQVLGRREGRWVDGRKGGEKRKEMKREMESGSARLRLLRTGAECAALQPDETKTPISIHPVFLLFLFLFVVVVFIFFPSFPPSIFDA